MKMRSRVAMVLAEFLGTAVLATVAISASRSQIGIGYFVAIAVGATLAFLIMALGPTSGGHFNPAVTLGLWTVRKVNTIKAVAYIVAQVLGGIAAWQLAEYFIDQPLRSIANTDRDWKIAVVEGIGTFIFTFILAAVVYQRYNGAKAASVIGGGYFIGVLAVSLASNGILNPALAIANQSYSMEYIIGPLAGGIVGINLYVLVFAPVGALLLPIRRQKTAVTSTASATKSSTRTTTRKASPRKKSTTRKKTTTRKK